MSWRLEGGRDSISSGSPGLWTLITSQSRSPLWSFKLNHVAHSTYLVLQFQQLAAEAVNRGLRLE
jgi:hypothetical protein